MPQTTPAFPVVQVVHLESHVHLELLPRCFHNSMASLVACLGEDVLVLGVLALDCVGRELLDAPISCQVKTYVVHEHVDVGGDILPPVEVPDSFVPLRLFRSQLRQRGKETGSFSKDGQCLRSTQRSVLPALGECLLVAGLGLRWSQLDVAPLGNASNPELSVRLGVGSTAGPGRHQASLHASSSCQECNLPCAGPGYVHIVSSSAPPPSCVFILRNSTSRWPLGDGPRSS